MSAPYPQPVSTDYPRPSRVDVGLLRDLFAVFLVIAGIAGLVGAAFAFDWRVGLATLSVCAICAGAYLGYER